MSSSFNHEGTTEAPAFKYEYHSEDEEDNSAQSGDRLNSDDSSGSKNNSVARHLHLHRKKIKLRQRRNPVSKFVNPSYESELEDGQSTSGDESSSESPSPDDSSSTSISARSETLSSARGRLRLGHAGADTSKIQAKQKPRLVPALKYVLSKMARLSGKYHKEIGLIFFLIASALSLVKKGPAKIQTASSPQPFFPPAASRYLQDNYNGDYADLARNTIPYVPTFVFYYAPWDSESLDARNEFLNVAHYFHNTEPGLIKFVGVNCWYVNGQCRQNYKSMSHFPIFVMHAMSPTGVIYSGPIRSQLMIRFIHLALKPMTRLDTEDNFWNFRSQHDVLLLSYFNFTEANGNNAYETYRQVALRHLELDSFGQVGFGVILKPHLAEKYFLNPSTSTISLVLFNEIHTAKWTSGFHENEENTKGGKGPVIQILEWVTERSRKLPITWLYSVRNGFANRPVSLAPADLSKEILKGPTFLLVTKRYYPSSYSPFYNQVKEVALDYFNCNQSGNVTKLRRTLHKLNADWMKLWKSIGDICLNSKTTTFNCKMLLPQLEHWRAKKSFYIKDSISNFENISSQLNFAGLSCASQRQFQFFAVDPVDIPHFVEVAFGLKQYNVRYVDGGNSSNISFGKMHSSSPGQDPMAFIIDAQNEVLMPFTSFNISELARTIHSFTMESESGCARPSHLIVESDSRKRAQNVTKERQLVQKFSSEEFLEYLNVMNGTSQATAASKSLESKPAKSTSLFLMYTAKFCGFCNVVLTQFLKVGKFLENYNVNVTLGKIDTYANSLPSALNPDTIPSFVLYSSATKPQNASTPISGIEGRTFPVNEEVTAKTLLRFLLSELDPATRVRLSLNATARKCSNAEPFRKADCLYTNKLSVTNQIQSVLEKLSIELGFTTKKDTAAPENLLLGEEAEMLQVGRPITLWETELLDHLRSVKLILDVT